MIKINIKNFKNTLNKFSTGITVISINHKEKYIGKTVNSFASLSLNPPLVLFSLDKKSSSIKNYINSSFIGINILSRNQKLISNHFSMRKPMLFINFPCKTSAPMPYQSRSRAGPGPGTGTPRS